MAEQSTHITKQCLQSGISENTNLNQVIKQRKLESINLNATNGTFVTKGEMKVTF